MDAFAIPSLHPSLALKQLSAVGTLECKRHLSGRFRLAIVSRARRRDRKDQFAVGAQSTRSIQSGIAKQNEFAAWAGDFQLHLKRLNLDGWYIENRLAFRTLALFTLASIGHSHLFVAMGTSEFDGHVRQAIKRDKRDKRVWL